MAIMGTTPAALIAFCLVVGLAYRVQLWRHRAPPPPPRSWPGSGGIQVMGVGAPRTGTESLHRALSALGYMTAHSEHVLRNPTVSKLWATTDPHFKMQMITALGFNATTDHPFIDLAPHMAAAFPEMKVILTTHPGGPEGWVQSAVRNALAIGKDNTTQFFKQDSIFILFGWSDPLCSLPTRSNASEVMLQVCKSAYVSYTDHMRTLVPPERLLEFSVKEGWAPLCEFLGKPVPNRTFPNVDWTRKYFSHPDP
mmetsp:Transcript_8079/g.21931  ORF Transcript_8079/g.21931 Transcript_8079/m.21931 type:complete len:253 (-) Transcript_8079:28-786(-)